METIGALPAHVRVVIIGAGFSGIGATIRLVQAGVDDVVVLERSTRIGGTWRDNTYPGCACDVPSHLYSFSFAPNPAWTRAYSPQPEILRYLEDVVDRFGIRQLVRCGVEVTDSVWDDAQRRWRVTTSAGGLTADIVVVAAGPLSEPSMPDLPGIESFRGEVLHSARWRDDVDVRGKRVAVVGTGASAIQVVPAIAPVVQHLTVFQRTPPWVVPRRDRPIPAGRRRLYSAVPPVQRLVRGVAYTVREAGVLGFVVQPALLRVVERVARRHLARQVPDLALRAVLTPSYRAGCKRLLLSDDYYPTLNRPNVEVVPAAVVAFDGDAVISGDGSRHPADVVVVATGFETTEMPIARRIRGRGGRLLAHAWGKSGMQALRGTTVRGFPNLFFVIGPNTGLGHTSMIFMIESQLNYLVSAIAAMDRRGIAVVEPTSAAQQAWNDDLQRRMPRTVWASGGCVSWYQDARGRITTLWPRSTVRFRRETRAIDLGEYDTASRGAPPRPSLGVALRSADPAGRTP